LETIRDNIHFNNLAQWKLVWKRDIKNWKLLVKWSKEMVAQWFSISAENT
jgi:hypothetical protein